MLRSGLFWKVLLPGVGAIVAAAVVMSAQSLSAPVRGLLMLLVVIASVLHAIWITRRVVGVAEMLSAAIGRMGTDRIDDRWSDELPVEVTSLARAAADLERRLQDRIQELHQDKTDFANTTALLETVLSTMVEGVVVLDREQRILFANSASHPLLDIQSNNVTGRPLWEISRLPPVSSAVEHVLDDKQRQAIEFAIPRTRLVVAATIAALPRDPVPGVMLVLHDVTELRQLETMRSDFVSNVSHELKTPLTSIQAYADTLLETSESDPEQLRAFLEKIVEQGERLGALIVDVIRLGKIESEPDVFDVRPVAVDSVIRACLDEHAAIAATKQIALSREPAAGDVHILADASELRTILDNLVDNALHHTSANGSVCVRVIPAETSVGLVGIEVADTGVGLARDQQKRIFERFYRVDRARDRQRGGTGLGLAIVKHLCQLFGGRVEVHSELGVGSTFTVWLPAAPSNDPSAVTGGARSAGVVPSAEIP